MTRSKRVQGLYPQDGREPKRRVRAVRYIKMTDRLIFVRSAQGLYTDTYDNFQLDVASVSETLDNFPNEWDDLYWSNNDREGHFFTKSDDERAKRYPIPPRRSGQFNRICGRVTQLIAAQDARDVANGEEF